MKIVYVFLLSILVLSCEKDEAITEDEAVLKSEMLGSWKVSYLEHADVSLLSGYVFDFNTEDKLVIKKLGEENIYGTWCLLDSGKKIKILIPEKGYPLRTLHSEWGVNLATTQQLKLTEVNSENDFLEKSNFTRINEE